MQTLRPFILVLTIASFSVLGCAEGEIDDVSGRSNTSAQELRQQKEELEIERNELERENAELTAEIEAQEAATRAKAEAATRTYSEDMPAGIWTVRMTCVESDCENRSVGDVITEQWNLTYSGGQYSVAVTNRAPNTNQAYSGKFDGKHLHLNYARNGGGFERSGSKIKVKLQMDDTNSMFGVREVLNSNPCSIEYEIRATRSK